MRIAKLLAIGAVTFCATGIAQAQTANAIRQVDSVQQRRDADQALLPYETGETAPDLIPDESSDVGPQSVLKVQPRRTHFEAYADAQYFYTDNMFLADGGKVSTDVLVSTVQAALAPTAYELHGGQFAPRLGFRQEWFNYGLANSDKKVDVFDFDTLTFKEVKLKEFNFNAQTIFTDAQWRSGNWIVGAGFDFLRLMDKDYDQFYREYVPRWGLWRVIPVSEASTMSIGYEGDYRFTATDNAPTAYGSDFNDRTDHSLVVNYNHALCERAVLQPYYRFQYTHFTEGESRDDYLNTFGLTVLMPITANISLRTFVSYSILCTSSSVIPDYNEFDAGGGINLSVRF